jgi:hypothetical protein
MFAVLPFAYGQVTGVRVYSSNVTTRGGLRGLHIDRAATSHLPNGISFDYGGEFAWGMGLDGTMDYSYPVAPFELPDLILAFSAHTRSDNLRLRSDDARMVLGPRIGHPMLPYQFSIIAGTQDAPLGGLAIGTFSHDYSLHMFNRDPTTNRTGVNLANLWTWGTDLSQNGGSDLFLYNCQKDHPTITVTTDDVIGLAGTLQHQGTEAGFFGANPVPRPVVTGSWSDGSAARSLCQALARLGLVQDATTTP